MTCPNSMIISRPRRQRKGVILSLLAVLGIFLIVILMFFVDVAYMQLTRTELQAATDAAAKAACEAIDTGASASEVRRVAIEVAQANTVGGEALQLKNADIVLGQSDLQSDGSWLFNPGQSPFTAVQVNAEKSAGRSGAVKLFFSGALGNGEFTPTQTATASQFDHEIMLCVDRSHSMSFDFSGSDWSYPPASADPNWNPDPETEFMQKYCLHPHVDSRWGALDLAVNVFLNTVEERNAHQQQRVGLVTWAAQYESPCGGTYPAARTDAQLGLNFDIVRNAMSGLRSKTIQGGTNMWAGLNRAVSELTGPNSDPLAKKTIILFTDGQWNQGPNPATITQVANNNNITIHVVSLLGNLDMTEMDDLGSDNNGIHYNASTEAELIAAFQTLAQSMPVVLTQ